MHSDSLWTSFKFTIRICLPFRRGCDHAKSHCQIDRPFKRIVALLYFYKVCPPPVQRKWSANVLSGKTAALIDYLWPLCLIVGKPVNREEEEKGGLAWGGGVGSGGKKKKRTALNREC